MSYTPDWDRPGKYELGYFDRETDEQVQRIAIDIDARKFAGSLPVPVPRIEDTSPAHIDCKISGKSVSAIIQDAMAKYGMGVSANSLGNISYDPYKEMGEAPKRPPFRPEVPLLALADKVQLLALDGLKEGRVWSKESQINYLENVLREIRSLCLEAMARRED